MGFVHRTAVTRAAPSPAVPTARAHSDKTPREAAGSEELLGFVQMGSELKARLGCRPPTHTRGHHVCKTGWFFLGHADLSQLFIETSILRKQMGWGMKDELNHTDITKNNNNKRQNKKKLSFHMPVLCPKRAVAQHKSEGLAPQIPP